MDNASVGILANKNFLKHILLGMLFVLDIGVIRQILKKGDVRI